MHNLLQKRQCFGDCFDDPYVDGYWGYSRNAVIIKWSIVGAILLFFIAWFVGGYYHAQRRMRKGLRPLLYHRWLLPRSQRMRFQPELQNQFSFYRTQNNHNDGYGMQAFPPPAYNTDHVPPPTYQPPEGATKVNPVQDYVVPPPGHPPAGPSTSSEEESQTLEIPPRPVKTHWMSRLIPFK